uniref:ChSh domain-containing protein n=1 Tax=Strongyloides stercoralis TaxID=6248 RepID=A0A0K0E3E2_STRER
MSTIKIKNRVCLPWRSISNENISTDQESSSSDFNVTSDEDTDNRLRTSQFSNLSKISADTPPSYSVSENSNGEMVSHKRGVTWPNRPLTGYHSIKEHRKRKAFLRKKIMERNKRENDDLDVSLEDQKKNKKNSKCIKNNKEERKSGYDCFSETNISKDEKKFNEEKDTMKYYKFCGIKCASEIKDFVLDYDTYYIFYDSSRLSKEEIPYEVPLTIAYYKKNSKKIMIEELRNEFRKFLYQSLQKRET